MKRTLILPALLILAGTVWAQADSTEKQKVRLKLGVNYNSNLHYFGRTDSLRSSGFFPQAEVWFTKEFYVTASPVFVSNAAQPLTYAGTVATMGYMKVSDHWIKSVYLLKPFYQKSAQLVQSALQAQGGTSFTWINKVVNLTAGGDIKYSDRLDWGATAGIDRLVKTKWKGSVLVIDPSVYVYAGTQNFTRTYYRKKTDFLLFPGNTQQVTENVQRFSVLAYEASVPLIWVNGKWVTQVTPAYVIPQHLVTVPNRPDLSERGRNLFYITAGIKRTL